MINHIKLYLFGILVCLALNIVADKAIINGHIATSDKFPYQVALVTTKGKNICGGAIIYKRFVLTAAHCLIRDNNEFYGIPLYVLAGTNNLNDESERSVRIQVKRVYVPKEYVAPPYSSTGDIAVLKLKESFKLNADHKHLTTVNLPTNIHETYDRKTAIIAGFGYTRVKVVNGEDDGDNDDGLLRYAETDIWSNDECHHIIPHNGIFSIKHLCAKVKPGHNHGDVYGVCIGDSGSSLVHGNTAVGVLSSSPLGCSEKVFPAMYTRVTEYWNFINDAVNEKKKNLRTIKLAKK